MSGDRWALSLDTIFELLCRRRRRYALYVLYHEGEHGISIEELATRVSELETGESEETPYEHQTLVLLLRERHLPKLAEAHVVDFDERSGTVRYHEQPSLEEWIEHAEFKEGKHPDA
jgi:DNA-binding transcriptional ArsR family regulator